MRARSAGVGTRSAKEPGTSMARVCGPVRPPRVAEVGGELRGTRQIGPEWKKNSCLSRSLSCHKCVLCMSTSWPRRVGRCPPEVTPDCPPEVTEGARAALARSVCWGSLLVATPPHIGCGGGRAAGSCSFLRCLDPANDRDRACLAQTRGLCRHSGRQPAGPLSAGVCHPAWSSMPNG